MERPGKMRDVVIRVENLCKEYHLGTISHGTLSQDLQSRWAKFRGKEDPNTKIDFDCPGPAGNTNERFYALKGVSFDVYQGEIVGIIGRNGAGKSTLLKIMSRVTAPTSGTIKIKGRIASLLEVGTGFHPELTGRENVFLNGAILGMRKGEIDKKFDEIVKFSEIEKFIDTPVKRYSSGMYVRLAFAVAAHLEPEILLLDEVLAVGDTAFQKKCMGKIGDVAKEGRTILFVSHNMAAVQRLCTSAILIDGGKIVEEGDVDNVTRTYLDKGYEPSAQWERTEPQNTDAYFERIYLSDDNGSIVASVTANDKISLVIEFCIVRNIENLQIAINITNDYGETIFASSPEDVDILTPKEKGNYSGIVTLPSNILLPMSYGIAVSLYIAGGKGIDHVENLTFSVQDVDCWSNRIHGGRRGFLAIPCPWKIVKLEK
jgi:lipopolysaccharide transport system ATP-binding protein